MTNKEVLLQKICGKFADEDYPDGGDFNRQAYNDWYANFENDSEEELQETFKTEFGERIGVETCPKCGYDLGIYKKGVKCDTEGCDY